MTNLEAHLSVAALEEGYETAREPIAKSHFHAIWLFALGHSAADVARLLSFSTRWVKALVKRYNEGGPERLGDQRAANGSEPSILTQEALAALKARILTPPDDGGWRGPENLAMPDGVRLVFQPPHRPQLQPAEHLWEFVDEPLVNSLFKTLDELDEAIAQRCVALTSQCETIRASTKFHWWPEQVDVNSSAGYDIIVRLHRDHREYQHKRL